MKRNKFTMSHYKLLTMNMGNLIPLTWFEALPGDTIRQHTSALVRVSPLLSPVMHPVIVRIHHWFCPLRLIWDDFEDFITGGSDGNDSTVFPHISLGTTTESSLHDYLGIPPAAYGGTMDVSALPFRCYNLIYSEHYRDQDIVSEPTIDTGNGTDSTTDTDIHKVAWPKDYFTTARATEQKGTAVTIPLSASGSGQPKFKLGGAGSYGLESHVSTASAEWSSVKGSATAASWDDPALDIDINDLRLSLAIQRYMENRMRYGSRYVEYLRANGVISSDARLSIPEYLGGGRQTIQFSEVLATADSGSYDVGDMLGHGISAMKTNRYIRYIEEHGIVMTMMSVVPKAIYPEALHRGFFRETKEDYYQRELANIGEQAITNKEVRATHASPDTTFGYVPRYDDYRYHPSSVSGEFRTTLNHWHYGRIFASDPALNQTFTDCTPTNRVYASSSTDCLYVMANHSIQARRLMARFAKPRTF